MRSGYVNPDMGSLIHPGTGSYAWSVQPYAVAAYSYNLAFNAADVSPSTYYNRWGPFPLRCLAD